jgi:hypothetical protein
MSTNHMGLFADLPIYPVTRHLVERLCFDMPLSPAMVSDFGITSEAHYRALRTALFADDRADEDEDEESVTAALRQRILALDHALGHGERLTAFVARYAPHYAGQVKFRTVLDILYRRQRAEQT